LQQLALRRGRGGGKYGYSRKEGGELQLVGYPKRHHRGSPTLLYTNPSQQRKKNRNMSSSGPSQDHKGFIFRKKGRWVEARTLTFTNQKTSLLAGASRSARANVREKKRHG